MNQLIGIETKRYSTFMKLVLEEFCENVSIQIGTGVTKSKIKTYEDKDIPWLLQNWCTNKKLKSTAFFSLKQNGEELFGFFDHPDNMWSDISTLPFIEKAASNKVIYFNVVDRSEEKSWFSKLMNKII
ncbi:hypothetical protein GCM10009133_40000 [Cocleimonas flava]|uniref:Uncharacterized protein n=1 Tax=Cocleimonas flava TaxID=634765 RepID=A0A4R1EKX7_9GAMM|nr:hypothetical protein [Cocleimonas flava]TCJ81787.1 hypothetical protein EV695_4067 [Cocleimonas flava]